MAFLSNVAFSHILCFNRNRNPNPNPNPVNLKAKKLNVIKATLDEIAELTAFSLPRSQNIYLGLIVDDLISVDSRFCVTSITSQVKSVTT